VTVSNDSQIYTVLIYCSLLS